MLKNKKFTKRFLCIAIFILVVSAACVIYVSDYYHADSAGIAAFAESRAVSEKILQEGVLVYAPEEPVAGLIFYPGGKVEFTAYQPLMQACAENGILCVLMKMPGNLAVLDIYAADGIAAYFPEIEKWYIGGHSLGGSMAASYAAKHAAVLDGLVLLAAYSTENLSETSLEVLSVYGSEDSVLNAEKYQKHRNNLPDSFTEVVLEGGCHAYFCMYGLQSGDGTPTLTNTQQILLTADHILEFISSNK